MAASRYWILDAHNDYPVTCFEHGRPAPNRSAARSRRPMALDRTRRGLHTSLPRMRAGRVGASYMTVGIRSGLDGLACLRQFVHMAEQAGDALVVARSAGDVQRAVRAGRIACVLSLESGRALEGRLEMLEVFAALGVRSLNVVHWDADELSLQGTRSPVLPIPPRGRRSIRRGLEGLTPFGRDAVKLANALGLQIDLAHANDRTFDDVMRLSATPPIVSHACCYALCDWGRNVTDDQIRRLADRGGVVGITMVRSFLGYGRVGKETFVDHVCHAVEVGGVDAVGIGTDHDGTTHPVFAHPGELRDLPDRLRRRGFSAAETAKICHGNFLRALRAALHG